MNASCGKEFNLKVDAEFDRKRRVRFLLHWRPRASIASRHGAWRIIRNRPLPTLRQRLQKQIKNRIITCLAQLGPLSFWLSIAGMPSVPCVGTAQRGPSVLRRDISNRKCFLTKSRNSRRTSHVRNTATYRLNIQAVSRVYDFGVCGAWMVAIVLHLPACLMIL